MSGRPGRATLAIAVCTGVIGGTLIGAGALGFDRSAASAAGVCPEGTVLYGAVQAQQADPGTTPTVVPAADQTDPFASTVADPDSYLCVVPGLGAAPASPAATPLVSATPNPTTSTPDAPDYVIPAPMGDPALLDPIASPEPSELPPGLIPSAPSPTVPTTPVGESGPNDGGEPPSDLPAPPVDIDPVQGKTITRDEVIGRAVSWILQGVPYSQTSWWTDSNGTYRQDCSGYVSMAWNLNQRVNYWTGNLANVSHRIASSALQPGDILLLPRSHVVLFAGWANSARTKFHLYEEYSRGKPARYVTNADLSYYLNRGYGAYRYDKIADVKRGRPGPQSTVYSLASFSTPLDGIGWTPTLADDHDKESEMPAGRDGQVTLAAVPDLPVETLVDAQLTTDERALIAAEAADGSTGLVLIAAGFGLLFLGLPLTIASRAGVWTPAHARRPEPPA